MSFNNKVVLITGAGSGIGATVAVAFAKQNAKLSLIDIVEEDLNSTVEECEKTSEVLKIVTDLTGDENVKRIVGETIGKFAKLDVLVNCAGIYLSAGILDDNVMDTFDRIIPINLRAAISLTSNAAQALIDTKGSIVNICSVVAKLTTKQSLAYSISKAALLHFTKCVALELAEKGVRVNSVSPGMFRSKLHLHAGMNDVQIQSDLDFVASCTPLKKLVEVEEVAELVLYLASDSARSITGSDYEIEGGVLLSGIPSIN